MKDDRFFKHFHLFGLNIYLTTAKMKKRQMRNNDKSHEIQLGIKAKIVQEQGCKCEMCGMVVKRFCELQVHHVLPWARYPQYELDRRNIMLLCRSCHNEIHHNPFLESKMIREKSNEIGVDLKPFEHERNDKPAFGSPGGRGSEKSASALATRMGVQHSAREEM